MDITENNFRIMSEYLSNTLSPDVNVRRPGKILKPKFPIFMKLKRICVSQFHSRTIFGESGSQQELSAASSNAD